MGVPIASETPQDLQLIDLGNGGVDNMGSYQQVNDLDTVNADIQTLDGDIRRLFENAGILSQGENAAIIVTSALSQVVAGINYKVYVTVGQYSDILISYFVPLPDENGEQIPTDLQLIDAGTYDDDEEVIGTTMTVCVLVRLYNLRLFLLSNKLLLE